MKIEMTKSKKIVAIICAAVLVAIIITLSVLLPIMYSGAKGHIESIEKMVQKVETRALTIDKNEQGYYTIKNDATNQPFKILQLTDLHITNGSKRIEEDSRALSAIANVVTAAKPDLVVITGDLIYSILNVANTSNNMKAAKVIGALMETLGVPWTLTYGNHDAEVGYTHSKTALSKYFESLEHCLFLRGDKDIKGQGNAYIELLNNDGSLNQILFMLDSNAYSAAGGYDKIRDNQVEWYAEKVAGLKEKYGEFKSLMFFHIPLEAYKNAWAEYKSNNYKDTDNVQWNTDLDPDRNKWSEDVCSPRVDGKMFDEILNQKVTQGIFVGHDHTNNFSLIYKGVTLTYGLSIDYVAYGEKIFNSTWQRGGMLITVGNDKTFDNDKSFSIKPIFLTDINNDIHID